CARQDGSSYAMDYW
nr:immunoglobulin heavy chain junction region [Mus musculus]MBK4189248.1 immunoglobulin heavy chain junction region [Mus musculus]